MVMLDISTKTIEVEGRVGLVVHLDDGVIGAQRLGNLMTVLCTFESFERILVSR